MASKDRDETIAVCPNGTVGRAGFEIEGCAMIGAMSCIAVVLQLGSADPVARLGMDGKWNVPDWTKLEQFEQTQKPADACIARELRIQRSNLSLTDQVNTECPPGEWNLTPGEPWSLTAQKIIAADPVMSACGRAVR